MNSIHCICSGIDAARGVRVAVNLAAFSAARCCMLSPSRAWRAIATGTRSTLARPLRMARSMEIRGDDRHRPQANPSLTINRVPTGSSLARGQGGCRKVEEEGIPAAGKNLDEQAPPDTLRPCPRAEVTEAARTRRSPNNQPRTIRSLRNLRSIPTSLTSFRADLRCVLSQRSYDRPR